MTQQCYQCMWSYQGKYGSHIFFRVDLELMQLTLHTLRTRLSHLVAKLTHLVKTRWFYGPQGGFSYFLTFLFNFYPFSPPCLHPNLFSSYFPTLMLNAIFLSVNKNNILKKYILQTICFKKYVIFYVICHFSYIHNLFFSSWGK